MPKSASWWRRLRAEEGQATVETAFGIAALVIVMTSAVSAVITVSIYLGMTDAAGALARAHARGDTQAVAHLRGGAVDPSAQLAIDTSSTTVTVTLTREIGPLQLRARAVALKEQDL